MTPNGSYDQVIKQVEKSKGKKNKKLYKRDILTRFESIYFKVKHKIDSPFKRFFNEDNLK